MSHFCIKSVPSNLHLGQRLTLVWLLMALCSSPMRVQADTMTCAGGNTMVEIAQVWAKSVMQKNPHDHITVRDDINLSAKAFDEFMIGKLDCVLFVREPFPNEYRAYQAKEGHAPILIPVGLGSYKIKGSTHAIGVLVHKDNPIQRISIRELEALLAARPVRGMPQTIHQWGELGLKDAWQDQPVHVYGMLRRRTTGDPPGIMNYIQQRILLGGEFRRDMTEVVDQDSVPALQGIANQVAIDRLGIGLSGFGNVIGDVKTIPVYDTDGSTVTGDADSVASARYPLTRRIYIMLRPEASGRPGRLPQAFLQEALSSPGQQALRQSAEGFLPLPQATTSLLREFMQCSGPGYFYRPALIHLRSQPTYQTERGGFRMVGYNDMAGMIEKWNELFHVFHPELRIESDLPATRAAPAALMSGKSFLAPMGAPFEPHALDRYQQVMGNSPLRFEVANASLSSRALSGPIGVFTSRNSQLQEISLPDLKNLFSEPASAGLELVGLDEETSLGRFMLEQLKLEKFHSSMHRFRQSSDVVKMLTENDRMLGFAAAQTATKEMHPLSIAHDAQSPFIPLNNQNLISGLYPLTRKLYMHIRSELPLDPIAKDYLNLVLSCQGQQVLTSDERGYLPLGTSDLQRNQQLLDQLR